GLQLVLRINDAVFRVRQTARQDDYVCFLKIGIKEGRNELPDPKHSIVDPKNELKADLELWKNKDAANLFTRIALADQ
ncbi:hypothetical protein AB9F41_38290, partial [Rhizobium leguminosarum]|uniref:hypothetical protein n=1 Tax=Rhizobium leguminosarum TaxID=384 RepID=UPI003F9E8AE1